MIDLTFTAGSTLTVVRATGGSEWNKLGDREAAEATHNIGPCSIVDSHGQTHMADNGQMQWVGTVTVEVQVNNASGILPDVRFTDRVILPNGDVALVIQPPEVPRNPFTGWVPCIRFTLAAPGYTPADFE